MLLIPRDPVHCTAILTKDKSVGLSSFVAPPRRVSLKHMEFSCLARGLLPEGVYRTVEVVSAVHGMCLFASKRERLVLVSLKHLPEGVCG